MRPRLLPFLAPVLAGLPLTALGQAQTLIDLGAGVRAYGINASGQITGCATSTGGAMHAFVYSAGTMTDLGTLGGATSCGYAINAGGQVTGYADTANASHAFLHAGRPLVDLGTVGGVANSAGTSINTQGDVVGYAWPNAPFAPLAPGGIYGAAAQVANWVFGEPTAHAFLYTHGTMTDLFPPNSPVFAFGINDAGEIIGDTVGMCGFLCPTGQAFSSLGGTTTGLADLAGNAGSVFLTAVTGVNAAGQIVAYGEDPDAYMHGMIYVDGVPRDFGNNTEAFALNSQGQAVGVKISNSKIGTYGVIDNDVRAFIYRDGAVTDLSMPGAIPSGINDALWIILNHFTSGHAYLYRPSPVSLTPPGIPFDGVAIGTSTPPDNCNSCTLILKNGTAAAIALTPIEITGPFTQTTTCKDSLDAGASCTIFVVATPTSLQTALGSVTVGAGGTRYASLLSIKGTVNVKLSASVSTVALQTPFTLTWTATPGSTCTASSSFAGAEDPQWSGIVAASGSKSISESKPGSARFTLTCTQGDSTAASDVGVNVFAPHSGGGSLDFWLLGVLAVCGVGGARASARGRIIISKLMILY